MSRPPLLSLRAMMLLLVAIVFPVAAFAQTEPVNVTAAFVKGGAVIEGLSAVQFRDIVIIKGKTNEQRKADAATRIATSLGYARVANLIVVRDDASDDAAIEFTGQLRLELETALDGCRFRVESTRGVIVVSGHVRRDDQAELAVHILSRIDGVKEVRPNLPLL